MAVASVTLAGVSVIGLSCLPDLAALPVAKLADAGPTVGPPCGDGVIDIEAGEQCDPGSLDAGAQCTSTCAIVCDGGLYDERTGHCYTAAGREVTYTIAKASCQALGGHVVTFASEDEYTKIVTWNPTAFWIGLAFDDQGLAWMTPSGVEPGWLQPLRCPGCYAHLEAGATIFPQGGFAKPQPCLVGSQLLPQWAQYPCTFVLGAICEREPLGSYAQNCLGGRCITLRATFGTKRYVYVSTPATAASAKSSCIENGGTLVVLETREEREQLAHELLHLVPATPTAVWIGLTRKSVIEPWLWEDRQALEAHPIVWGDREPKVRGLSAAMAIKPGIFDTQLARADDGTSLLTYVCELR